MRAAAAAGAVLVAALAGCGSDDPSGPPPVQVDVGSQQVDIEASQFCLDGQRQRYSSVTPPVIEAPVEEAIEITVPDSVAKRGWSVQIFDEKLQTQLGQVDVEAGTRTFDGTPGDDVPAAFYLVVVEKKGTACGEFSGAWPVGFIRSTAPTEG